jgi:uncharacterized protein
MLNSPVVDSLELLPVVPYLGRNSRGEPYLWGSRCENCGETFMGDRKICAKCSARSAMRKVAFGRNGKLYNYTIVHRSRPGVKTPFVSAIVDLEGGGVLKGTLVAPVDSIRFDMPVTLTFGVADQVDAQSRSYLTYYFVPA